MVAPPPETAEGFVNDLFVAALVFLGAHIGIASTPLRAQLIASIGERPYRLLFSLVSFVTLVWLVLAYRRAAFHMLWEPGSLLHAVPFVVMPFALFLVVCGMTSPNPTAIGQNPDADAPEPATGILRVTRHPFMWGVGLWAIAHILANGDLASLVFFGGLGVLALLGATLIDARRNRENPLGWGVFLQRTSYLPFAAILQGRQRLAIHELTLVQVGLTLGLYVLLLILHPWLFGATVLPQ
jgi:uncharacterized membrane protein